MSADTVEPELVPAQESAPAVPEEPSPDATASSSTAQPAASVTRTNTLSKMRSHRGNIPTLPQTKLCHLCPAKFTRTTHLNRHLKTHSNERMHECDRCHAQFTRSDLLTRHKRTCCDSSASRSRRKSCQSCAESKVKCDLQKPCAKCKARGRECVYLTASERAGRSRARQAQAAASGEADGASASSSSPPQDSPTESGTAKTPGTNSTTPSTDFTVPSGLFEIASEDPLQFTQNSFNPVTNSPPEDAVVTNVLAVGTTAPLQTNSESSALPIVNGNSLAVTTTSQNEEERGYLSDLFQSEMYDNLFTDIFTGFDKNPTVPGQHFQQDSANILIDRLEGTVIDHSSLGGPTDTGVLSGPAQLAMYTVPAPLPLPVDPVQSIPESELLGISVAPNQTLTLQGMPSIAEYYEYKLAYSMILHNDADEDLVVTAFLTTYSQHMPIVHMPTFLKESRHPLLVKASKACGAMYANTRASKRYIDAILLTTRDEIIAELSHASDFDSMTHLALASGLLQTIGMFHKDPEQRAKSNVYHGMIVMMLRMNGFLEQLRDFKVEPVDFADPESYDRAWRSWVRYETAKRAVWILFTHDCYHAVFFNLQPTFHNEHFSLGLPSEDGLWQAGDAAEWILLLQTPSRYGSTQIRLYGQHLKTMYNYLIQENPTNEAREFCLPPFGHFIMIHTVLRKLFELYLRDRLPFQQGQVAGGIARPKINPHYVDKVRVFHVQILLHCWLQSWLSSPETPRDVPESQQRFCFNALPLYWLAQVGLVAYQEGLPPFDPDGMYITSHEAKFHLMKKWEKHIRKFLEDGSQTTTVFWDEVMKIRTDTWTAESGFEYPHLLGFFLDN